MRKQLTEDEFKKLYLELSINELAHYTGYTRGTVTKIARKLNLPHKKKPLLILK